jgi:hypothetical protein
VNVVDKFGQTPLRRTMDDGYGGRHSMMDENHTMVTEVLRKAGGHE